MSNRRWTLAAKLLSILMAATIVATGIPSSAVASATKVGQGKHLAAQQAPQAAPPDIVKRPKLPPVVARVSVDAGGTLTTPDRSISVTFPPGAASETLDIALTQLWPAVWGASGMRVVNMFELKATAPNRGNTVVSQFAKDIDISFRLSEDYSKNEMKGLDIGSLGLYYLDETNGKWLPLSATLNRGAAPSILAKSRHFSIFGTQAAPVISGPGTVLAFQNDLHSGAATAQVPIEVPPGPGGFAPQLALSYNSGSVDEMKNKRDVGSWVGIGWSLKIGRVSANSETGQFSLDFPGGGYKLVPDPLASGAGYYRTEQESGLKIHYTPDQQWEVWDRNGTYYKFDLPEYYSDHYQNYYLGPCLQRPQVNYAYDLTLIRDTHGNEIHVTYNRDLVDGNCTTPITGYLRDVVSAYPLDISYGRNANDPSSLNRFNIHLNAGSDVLSPDGYGWLRNDNPRVDGIPRVRENKRLDSIEVQQDTNGDGVYETRVRKYVAAYNTTPYSSSYPFSAGMMTLTSIKQVGADGTSELPTMAFTYSTPLTYFHNSDPTVTWEPAGNPGNPAQFT